MTRIQSASQSPPDPNTIYCSVEVSRSSWIVGVHCPLTDANIGIHKLPPGGGNDLIELVRKSQARIGSGVPVMLCYEGFWLVRYLERQAPDIEVVVLDPASLQVDRRYRKVKTDRIDAERMIRALKAWHAGDGDAMAPVRVPSVEEEDQRRLVRERCQYLLKNKPLCRFKNVPLPAKKRGVRSGMGLSDICNREGSTIIGPHLPSLFWAVPVSRVPVAGSVTCWS
ncbi:MAG: hypothetical protein OXF95_00085 [Rhodobacteraceae bacterium]|nr:hypothetical protein [Paracoccaceae bacterium]